ncbi:MAG TPA: PhnD/SsuA/transferrin family substrate-binding protein, partial [Candidatus Eremiobacteraeota bacterium]|nr:PhnD/SsuA/transferrin family substrate-binding protein [Candidatus Eremiobacteraeota bacterium]
AREKEEVIPVLRSIEDGSPFTKSYIIVRKDSNLKTIEDLKHRKISFTDKSSAVGYLFPRVMLAKKSITDINTYFSEVKFTGDDFSSFLAVYNGYVDGGIVSQSVMRKKDDRLKEMKIIGETEAIPLGTVIIRPGMEKEYINKLNKAFLQIGKTIDTRDLTKTIKIDGYVESTDSDYDGIRENIKILNKIEK